MTKRPYEALVRWTDAEPTFEALDDLIEAILWPVPGRRQGLQSARAESNSTQARSRKERAMFDPDRFITDCRDNARSAPGVLDVVARAVSTPAAEILACARRAEAGRGSGAPTVRAISRS